MVSAVIRTRLKSPLRHLQASRPGHLFLGLFPRLESGTQREGGCSEQHCPGRPRLWATGLPWLHGRSVRLGLPCYLALSFAYAARGSAALRGAVLATSGWSKQWRSGDPTSLEGGVGGPCELEWPVSINIPFIAKEARGRSDLPCKRDFNLENLPSNWEFSLPHCHRVLCPFVPGSDSDRPTSIHHV